MQASQSSASTAKLNWRSTSALEPEVPDDEAPEYRLVPRLLEAQATGETFWSVYIQHDCTWEGAVPLIGEEKRDPPKWSSCACINRKKVGEAQEEPHYQCDGCGGDVPENIVEHKLMRQRELKQVDPRTRRREAVLATRKKRGIR